MKNTKKIKFQLFLKWGKKNDWKKTLDPKIVKKIEKNFEKEMKNSVYLNYKINLDKICIFY